MGDEEESKNCMKMALRLSPAGAMGNDLIHTLPTLHMKMRDWFDNDDYEADVQKEQKSRERIQSKLKQMKKIPKTPNNNNNPIKTLRFFFFN